MKVIIVLLTVFVQTALATDLNKAKRKIEDKYACIVETLDGYKIKVDKFSSSRIIQFKLTNSEFIDNSSLSEAIASDCSLLIIDNILPSELGKYDTIIIVVTKQKVKNYEYRYGISELKKAKQFTGKVDKMMESFVLKKPESIISQLNKTYVKKEGESVIRDLIKQFPADLEYSSYGFTTKHHDNKMFYTFSFIVSNKTSKKRVSITCLFNGNEPFICGFNTSDKY